MKYIEFEKKANQAFNNYISQYSQDSHEFLILEGLRTPIIMTASSIYRNKKLLSLKRRLKREVKLIINFFFIQGSKTKNTLKKTNNTHELKNKEVLFWPSDISHVKIHKKIYKQTEQQNIESLVFVTNKSFEKELKEFPFFSYKEFLTSNTIPHRKSKYKILKKARFNSIRCQFENESISFYDIFLITFELYPTLLKTVEAFYYLINSAPQLKFVFIGNGLTLEGRLATLLSKKHKIATGEIQHGTIFASQIGNIVVDHFFVFNDYYQEMIRNCSNNTKAIPVGSVKYQKYFEKEFRQKNNLKLQEFTSKTPWIIALSGAGHSISERNHIAIIECIEKAICHFKDEYFIFKLHPKDKIKYYSHLEDYNNVYIVDQTHDLYSLELSEWIKLSKGMITGGSASALEAFLLDKYVLTIDVFNEITDLFFIQEGVSYHSQSFLDLKQNILSILKKDKESFYKRDKINSVKKSFFSREQLPSEQIATFVKKIITNK